MVDALEPHLQKYLDAFMTHAYDTDKLAQTILKGHLIIESALDHVINMIFFNAEYLGPARLSFSQKVKVVRAQCRYQHKEPVWLLMEAINSVRNEIAHELGGEKLKKKVDQLRRVYFETAPEKKADDKKPDEEIAMDACVRCTGFLAAFEDDVGTVRRFVDMVSAGIKEGRIKGYDEDTGEIIAYELNAEGRVVRSTVQAGQKLPLLVAHTTLRNREDQPKP
jgi:YD repeat-containing protein